MGDVRPGLDEAAQFAIGEVHGVRQDRPRAEAAGPVVHVDVVDRLREEPGDTSAISPWSSDRCVCQYAPVEAASAADSRNISAVHEIANRGVTA